MKRTFAWVACIAACSLSACGSPGTVPASAPAAPLAVRRPMVCSNVASMRAQLAMPKALRRGPAAIDPPPMLRAGMLPPSAMRSPAVRHLDASPAWTQIPGSGSQVAAAADGALWSGNNSLYVLSDQPAGSPDKYIWHYYYAPANGGTPAGWQWSNIPGMASHIAISPYDNTLFAVNSSGGVYAYCAANWTALGGGARSIAVDQNGYVYVVSNTGTDGAIWQFRGGPWTQLAGFGQTIAGTWDPTSYAIPSGIISSGVYILNSQGGIWHENPDQSFANFPGAASDVAPVTGGVVVLSYPLSANGTPLYYYSFAAKTWTAEPGAATSISSNGTNLYAIGTSGAIYEAPVSGL